MQVVGRVSVDMKPVKQIMKRLGVDARGDVQMQMTKMVCHRITRYIPKRAGVLSSKLKFIKSPTQIEILGPYARVHYYGKIMVDPKTGAAGFLTPNGWRSRRGVPKVVSNRSFDYKKTGNKHPDAGPFWDRRLMAAEGAQMAAELQEYVRRRGGR